MVQIYAVLTILYFFTTKSAHFAFSRTQTYRIEAGLSENKYLCKKYRLILYIHLVHTHECTIIDHECTIR